MTVTLNNSVAVFSSDLLALKNRVKDGFQITNRKTSTLQTGTQKSFFKTKGMNFDEVRQYTPGDDTRQIDWRTTAKFGKPFTKIYIDDTIQNAGLLIDMSASMWFASRGDFKSVVAAKIASLISWSVLDKKGFIFPTLLTSNGVKTYRPIKSDAALSNVFKDMESAHYTPNTSSFSDACLALKKNTKPGATLFVISDFYHFSDIEKLLSALTTDRTVILVHVYDPMEQNLPRGILTFSDGNDEIELNTNAKKLSSKFHDDFTTLQNNIKQTAMKWNAFYLPITTDEDYLSTISHFLNRRGS